MLDDFKNSQPLAYKMVENAIKKNRCSHAYIIEASDTKEALDFSISFAKYLFCPCSYTNNKNCRSCTQCQNIDEENYIELKIINPEGLTIKKQQLSELQQIFRNKSLVGTKKIYIINNADRLNPSSANTILKFLEEPEENIIALLVTSNIYNLIPTIISRCQVISLQSKTKEENILPENFKEVLNFSVAYEINKLNTINHINKLWLNNFKDKENSILGLETLILVYKIALDKKTDIDTYDIKEYEEQFKILEKNTIDELCKKITKIIKNKDRLFMNANVSLTMDRLIIELERS